MRVAGCGVGMAVHGGVGCDHQDVARTRGCLRSGSTGLDDAKHRDGHGVLNGIEGQRAGGVAGDDDELGALFADQELGALNGVACNGAPRLGPIGQPRRVADEGEVGERQPIHKGAQHGEASKAGIEDTDGECGVLGAWVRVCHCELPPVGTASAVK